MKISEPEALAAAVLLALVLALTALMTWANWPANAQETATCTMHVTPSQAVTILSTPELGPLSIDCSGSGGGDCPAAPKIPAELLVTASPEGYRPAAELAYNLVGNPELWDQVVAPFLRDPRRIYLPRATYALLEGLDKAGVRGVAVEELAAAAERNIRETLRIAARGTIVFRAASGDPGVAPTFRLEVRSSQLLHFVLQLLADHGAVDQHVLEGLWLAQEAERDELGGTRQGLAPRALNAKQEAALEALGDAEDFEDFLQRAGFDPTDGRWWATPSPIGPPGGA